MTAVRIKDVHIEHKYTVASFCLDDVDNNSSTTVLMAWTEHAAANSYRSTDSLLQLTLSVRHHSHRDHTPTERMM